MTRYLIRRFLEMCVTVFFASAVIFFMLHLSPGGPFDHLLAGEGKQDPGYIDRLNRLVGLDRPVHERYLAWLGNVVRGDWGTSWVVSTGRPVMQLVRDRLANTLMLMTVALTTSLLVALGVGIVSAVKPYSLFDHLATGFSFFGASMPIFWSGLVLILVFSLWLGLLPTSGMYSVGQEGNFLNRLQHLILPVTALTLYLAAQWSRFVRSSMVEVLRQDYVRTARAKGLTNRLVVVRHALRNAAIPLITVVALECPSLFSGAIITETIFAWPGMGRLYLDAVLAADWPVAMGLLLITAGLVVVSNLLADLLYALADPRIRYE